MSLADVSPAIRLEAEAGERSARRRWLLSRMAVYGALCLFAAIYLGPALIVVFSTFRTPVDVARDGLIALPRSFTLEPFWRVWTQACVSGVCEGIRPNFVNSLVLTVPATLIATAFGAVNGYVLSKWRFPGSQLIFGMMLLGVFLPPQITLLPWAFIMGKLGLANSVVGLILIHTVQGISFTTLFCRNFYVQIPDPILAAARIDGAGFWRIFIRIVVPLSPPILAVTVIWQFTSIWNEYLFGMVFTSGDQQPITAALMSVRTGGSSAAVLIAALPPMLVFLLGGRYFVQGLTQGAIR
ncbi:carbohydrate ABC transporter permease [Devosia sp.]|uniref:carbohydrate ABC transporter permease n=1 Tax=Devosia sp. TaxID=1871048 RepID=UPI003A91A002